MLRVFAPNFMLDGVMVEHRIRKKLGRPLDRMCVLHGDCGSPALHLIKSVKEELVGGQVTAVLREESWCAGECPVCRDLPGAGPGVGPGVGPAIATAGDRV